MAITGVSVVGPRAEPQQRDTKKDPLDEILKGVQIASGIFGIKASFDTAALKQAQLGQIESRQAADVAAREAASAEQTRVASGDLQPRERLAFGEKFEEVSPETPGAIGGFSQQLEGQDREEISFLSRDVGKAKAKAAADEAAAVKMAAKIAKDEGENRSKKEIKMRGEHTKASQDTIKAERGFRKVQAAGSGEASGVKDVALIFGFFKTIDPESTIREGEFATAENTGGADDRAIAAYNKLFTGERLTEPQRAQFVDAAKNQMLSQLQVQKVTDDRFTNLAERADLDVIDVVDPRFKSLAEELAETQQTLQKPVSQVSTQQNMDAIQAEFKRRGINIPNTAGN
jgi:hypothetical protein